MCCVVPKNSNLVTKFFCFSTQMATSSTKKPTPMPNTTFIFFLLAVVFLSHCSTPFGASSGYVGLECLKVSPSKFVGSLRNVVDVLQDVISTLSKHTHFSNGIGDSRLSNAISDCIELLGLSFDVLSWSVSATVSPQGMHNSTGNLSSDLRTWLSAILANIDTCMDGFEGTNGINLKGLISPNISRANSLVHNLLSNVHPITDNSHLSTKKGEFPSWVASQDQNLLQKSLVHVDAVVAADGTGNYTRVMDAVEAAPEYSMRRFVIYIKKGIYKENVVIVKKKWNIVVIGEGMDSTIISGSLSNATNVTTYKSATFAVNARGFVARDISFRNTAGPKGHQAVALRSDSDLSVFYRCGIFGYQDSLYAHTLRQFYRECKITGTVDFIFGYATAAFQNCQILVKRGLENQSNTITAQGKTDPNQSSCFSIQFCNISADHDLLPSINSIQTYLGRPWKPYSNTIFMQNYISDVLSPQGWLEWNGSKYLDTLYYAEYNNYGPGARLDHRVKWPGYHVMNNSGQVSNFTVAKLILGDLWLPSTGVNFTSGFGV